LTCKNRLPYNLYCVGGDVKHCTINQSINYQVSAVVCVYDKDWLQCCRYTIPYVSFNVDWNEKLSAVILI